MPTQRLNGSLTRCGIAPRMLLTVISALLGAYLGLSSRNKLMAALVGAALAGAAHFVLLYASAFAVAFASDPAHVDLLFTAVGVRGYGMTYAMGSAAAAALVSGILESLTARRAESGYVRRGPSPELERIGEVLSR